MDAPDYNGDDDREFGPDIDDDRCWSCGAREDEDCDWERCECGHCVWKRATDHLTGDAA